MLGLLLLGATVALYHGICIRYIKMVKTIHELSRVQPEIGRKSCQHNGKHLTKL